VDPTVQSNRAEQSHLPREEMLRTWLGVEGPDPTYYALLGLPELETRAEAVLAAGRRAKRKVRAYQIGIYRRQALALLGEIGQAVSTLTNPDKKRVYDNGLLARWRGVLEELAEEHLEPGPRTAEALQTWLAACRDRGVPVARLMPMVVRRLMARGGEWPAVGAHRLPLPVALWIYRDVAALGQCLENGPLEARAEAVKKVQRMLAVPQGVALVVAEEMTRAVHLYRDLRLVRQARTDPAATVLRLARRLRRWGGTLGHGMVLRPVAELVGLDPAEVPRLLERVDEPPVDLPVGRGAVRAARAAGRGVRALGARLLGAARAVGAWVAERPQLLVVLAVVAGVASLALALLVVVGVLRLLPPEPGPVAPGPGETLPASQGPTAAPLPPPGGKAGAHLPGAGPEAGRPERRPPVAGVSPGSSSTAPSGEGPSSPGPPPGGPKAGNATAPGLDEWLERMRQKYPARGRVQPAGPQEAAPPPDPEAGTPPDVKFFGVKGDKRGEGAPVEIPSKGAAAP